MSQYCNRITCLKWYVYYKQETQGHKHISVFCVGMGQAKDGLDGTSCSKEAWQGLRKAVQCYKTELCSLRTASAGELWNIPCNFGRLNVEGRCSLCVSVCGEVVMGRVVKDFTVELCEFLIPACCAKKESLYFLAFSITGLTQLSSLCIFIS